MPPLAGRVAPGGDVTTSGQARADHTVGVEADSDTFDHRIEFLARPQLHNGSPAAEVRAGPAPNAQHTKPDTEPSWRHHARESQEAEWLRQRLTPVGARPSKSGLSSRWHSD